MVVAIAGMECYCTHINRRKSSPMNATTKQVELRKIRPGEAFIIRATDSSTDRYIRGPYCYRADLDGPATFLCRHLASMTHHHFSVDAIVERAK